VRGLLFPIADSGKYVAAAFASAVAIAAVADPAASNADALCVAALPSPRFIRAADAL
jgi:hypothetical protein